MNELVFANGARFPICAESALRLELVGGGWRRWCVEGTCAEVTAALDSGLVSRDFTVDEDKTVREDLSEYSVAGPAADLRDGTVCLWARKLTELEQAQAETRAALETVYGELDEEHREKVWKDERVREVFEKHGVKHRK